MFIIRYNICFTNIVLNKCIENVKYDKQVVPIINTFMELKYRNLKLKS